MLAYTTDGDYLFTMDTALGAAAACPVRRIDPALPAPLKNRVLGNDLAPVYDPDLVGQLLDFDDAPGAIGNAVVIAADRDHPIVADAALQLQNCVFRKIPDSGFTKSRTGISVNTGQGSR
nr:hypothetical protein [Sphingobium cupriresistens]